MVDIYSYIVVQGTTYVNNNTAGGSGGKLFVGKIRPRRGSRLGWGNLKQYRELLFYARITPFQADYRRCRPRFDSNFYIQTTTTIITGCLKNRSSVNALIR